MTAISAIVTLHDEHLRAGPTLRSAEIAVARAEAAGLSVERLIGLDRPTAETAAYALAFAGDAWRVTEVDCGDQGAARNAYAAASKGDWIAFLDGDDLWSENWLTEAFKTTKSGEGDAIIHPEVNWFFGNASAIHVNVGQDDPLFDPRFYLYRSHYDALSFAPRAAHLDIPFAARDLERGYAFEDMQWAVETMLAGYRHMVAPDTIIFKRRRDGSQNAKAGARGVAIRDLPELRLENVDALTSFGWRPPS